MEERAMRKDMTFKILHDDIMAAFMRSVIGGKRIRLAKPIELVIMKAPLRIGRLVIVDERHVIVEYFARGSWVDAETMLALHLKCACYARELKNAPHELIKKLLLLIIIDDGSVLSRELREAIS